MIPIKTSVELEGMRASSKALRRIVDRLKSEIKVGMLTRELDSLAEVLIAQEGVTAAFKGYRGFPASTCISLNEEVVHGIPSAKKLKEGDLLKLDIGINKGGFFSDCAFTMALGRVDARTKQLIETTKKALELGVKQARSNNHLSDISWAIQKYVESRGFSVVRDFVGHGIGYKMHEEPEIPNFGLPHSGPVLKEGMILAIEPMINIGSWEVKILDNGWTAVTKDGLNSAHFEHTVAITAVGPEILTL